MNNENISDIVKTIGVMGYDFEHSLDPILRRKTGSYYTSIELTIPMVTELIVNLSKDKRKSIQDLSFLEPCVGTGNFVFAYILVASKNLNKFEVERLLNNIYVCDININALNSYKNQLTAMASRVFDIHLTEDYFNTHIGGGLLFDVTQDRPAYNSISDVFGNDFNKKFDIVITNPPYKNLKAEVGHYESEDAKLIDKEKYKLISLAAKKILPLSSYGTINLYKLFVEEIINKYSADDALVSLLVPSSILTDKTCEKIREKIIKDHHIISIKNIPENNRFIDAQQSLTALLIDKSTQRTNERLTSICKSYSNTNEDPVMVDLRILANPENGYTVFLLNKDEFELLKKMMQFPKIKELDFIINLRGELDLTANKTSIVSTKTPYRLLRGRNIGFYRQVKSDQSDYVDEAFISSSSKKKYITRERLACQQVSNIAKDRRLNFVKIGEDNVLANSCNFITVNPNQYRIDIDYLLGLLNSKLMNWFFKVQSSNNHINNYEINNFPIPIKGHLVSEISSLSKKAQISDDPEIYRSIDELVGELFQISNKGEIMKTENTIYTKNSDTYIQDAFTDIHYLIPAITIKDIQSIMLGQQTIEATLLKYDLTLSKFDLNVFEGIIKKYIKLRENIVLNHTTFKLSDLDLEMIKPIPQGGNWKDIPSATIVKSRRLRRITETGGRTTLYGRLHYDRPSYTITTYFNRPGNGTYVHPIHDRVLSVREAARLQAFPDDYYFYGNKTQLLKQIGNAVPALLAYQIGKKIVEKIGSATSLDLFCGAGGLTCGLKAAGIHTALCTDFNEAACTTIKINNPETDVVCGDITDDSIKDAITTKALLSNADIVCGGPPCQGFSMAGYRDKEDPRNQLFKEFVAVVEKTRPKIVLFENVEGILTFNGGETYNAVHTLFSELGYKTEGKLLKTDYFGVPQKRKRVIIMCTRDDLDLDPTELYPDEITTEDIKKVTVKDSIHDLESVICSDDAEHAIRQSDLSHYGMMLRKIMTPEEFLASLTHSTTNTQISLFNND